MKAQVMTKIAPIEEGPLSFQAFHDPVLRPHGVLIRVKACGVCHSNLHMIEGELQSFGLPARLPIVPGHEVVGVVEELGKAAFGFQVGQRVGIQVMHEACRHCEYCLTGREHLCLNRQSTGETVDGGYAELIEAPYDFIYALPDNLRDIEAAPLFCPGVTAYRSVRRAGVKFGQRVVIMGIGGVGHMSLQFVKLAGAEAIAVDVSQGQLDLARELGADHVLLPSEVDDFVKSARPDVVMVHTPARSAIKQGSKIVKRGGTILLAVLGELSPSMEQNVVTSVIGPRQDMRDVLNLASSRKIRVKARSYPLQETANVLARLKRGGIVGRAVVTP